MLRKKLAFTLIELLVVIAIIAILAAIIFPVFSRVKVEANRASDTSAMNNLRNALLQYRVDQGGYPPAILGYATQYMSGPNVGQVVPANLLKTYLYPKRVQSLNDFRPVNLRFNPNVVTRAVWPTLDQRAVGSAAVLDLNQDGSITAADDIADSRQRFGPADGCVTVAGLAGANCGAPFTADGGANFYRISGYDTTEVPISDANFPGGRRIELRYSLFWTTSGLGAGSVFDDPRQLGYADPPDTTILTWNSTFRDWTSGVPNAGRRDLAIFVGGSAKPFDSGQLHRLSFRVLP